MSKCPTCGYQAPTDYLKEFVKGATLPEGVALWDFGDGHIMMPKTDSNGSFLTSSVAYLYKEVDATHALFLEMHIPYIPGIRTPEQREEVLRQAVLSAIKSWPEGANLVEHK